MRASQGALGCGQAFLAQPGGSAASGDVAKPSPPRGGHGFLLVGWGQSGWKPRPDEDPAQPKPPRHHSRGATLLNNGIFGNNAISRDRAASRSCSGRHLNARFCGSPPRKPFRPAPGSAPYTPSPSGSLLKLRRGGDVRLRREEGGEKKINGSS